MNKPIIIGKVGIFKDWKYENPGSIVSNINSDYFIDSIKQVFALN
jgi:hypothetical protein